MNLKRCVTQTEAMMRKTVANFWSCVNLCCMGRWSDLHWKS